MNAIIRLTIKRDPAVKMDAVALSLQEKVS